MTKCRCIFAGKFFDNKLHILFLINPIIHCFGNEKKEKYCG